MGLWEVGLAEDMSNPRWHRSVGGPTGSDSGCLQLELWGGMREVLQMAKFFLSGMEGREGGRMGEKAWYAGPLWCLK